MGSLAVGPLQDFFVDVLANTASTAFLCRDTWASDTPAEFQSTAEFDAVQDSVNKRKQNDITCDFTLLCLYH